MTSRKQIGKLLVEAGIISAKTLERALEAQRGSGKRLGALLKEMGIVTEEEIVDALALQFDLKRIRNFAEHQFPKELLDLVPCSVAMEKLVFPLKAHQGTLAIAAADPMDHATFDYLAEKTGMKIYLAIATAEDILAAIKKHYPGGSQAEQGRKKILLIDPSPIVTNFLQGALEHESYEPIVANDGIEGLKLAFSYRPDLIICDLMMPHMDGYNFLHAVQAHPDMAEVPVILMASKEAAEEEHRALEAGFIYFIAKPAMPVRVMAKIKLAFKLAEEKRQMLSHVVNR
ncbi:MAG: response regulator [Geobacter sp.]|nr:response regulator [Geobacter sp.]